MTDNPSSSLLTQAWLERNGIIGLNGLAIQVMNIHGPGLLCCEATSLNLTPDASPEAGDAGLWKKFSACSLEML